MGCVQEEIRFVICPELMVTMLVTEALDDTEALIVTGIERYSKYEGYSNSFKWSGDFIDETPRDSSGRRMTSVVAIDALYFTQPALQFDLNKITRELNKVLNIYFNIIMRPVFHSWDYIIFFISRHMWDLLVVIYAKIIYLQ